MSHHPSASGRPSSNKRRLNELLRQSDNRQCADCSAPDPKWASANIGVFICLKCCGAHRGLGSHISKVLSVTLDEWSDDEVDAMVEVGGNDSANSIYEAYFPEGVSKPAPDASNAARAKFIRGKAAYYPTPLLRLGGSLFEALGSKYELQEFLKPSLRIMSSSSKKSFLQESVSRKIMDNFRSSSSSAKYAGMVEFIGMLKIKVIKGTNLAIRDMLSSDPYVVLTLGKQKAQTSVVKSNLNPVWNEELMLSVPEKHGAVKLEVFDYDTFSADDIMGEAEIDIQPMLTSAMAFGDAGMFGDMQIGKWLKSHDNALIEDSTVNIIDGKVKQEVSIKLQNVESGELELELEWIPLDQ